ncbi:TPA: AAA family ATPase [Photobacterium damselae]
MNITITIKNIINFKDNTYVFTPKKSIMGITGKNGSGKTTLFKALGNLINADFFSNYSSPYTVNESSEIIFKVPNEIRYSYNKNIKK